MPFFFRPIKAIQMEKQQTCPKCNTSEPPRLKNGLHECPNCGIFYEKVSSARPQDGSPVENETDQPWVIWPFFLVPVIAVSAAVLCFISREFNGPEFLELYCAALVVFLVALLIFRKIVADSFFVRVVFLAGFESIGISRFIYGVTHGMMKFDYLTIIMVLGGALLFFIFSNYHGYVGREGRKNSDGGCSGCSSGGCGGCGGD